MVKNALIGFLVALCVLLTLVSIVNKKRGNLYYGMYQENLELIDQLYYTIEEMESSCTE